MNGNLGKDGLAAQRHVAAREKSKGYEIVLLQNLVEKSVLQKLKRKRKSVVLKIPVLVGKETLNTENIIKNSLHLINIAYYLHTLFYPKNL